MTVTTVFADTSDASIRHDGAVYATVHDATSANNIQTTGTQNYMEHLFTGATYEIFVHFFPFDTSSISSSDTISAAELGIYRNGDNANDNTDSLGVVQSAQGTWNSLVVGDYDQRGDSITSPTEGCTRQSFSAGSTTGYFTFALNSTGMGWIARSGETKPASASASGKTQLAVRFGRDMDNSAPTGNNYMLIVMADNAGTTNDPYLTVTHAVAAAPTANPHNNLSLLGVS